MFLQPSVRLQSPPSPFPLPLHSTRIHSFLHCYRITPAAACDLVRDYLLQLGEKKSSRQGQPTWIMRTLQGCRPRLRASSMLQCALPPQLRDSTSNGNSCCSPTPSARNRSRSTCTRAHWVCVKTYRVKANEAADKTGDRVGCGKANRDGKPSCVCVCVLSKCVRPEAAVGPSPLGWCCYFPAGAGTTCATLLLLAATASAGGGCC